MLRDVNYSCQLVKTFNPLASCKLHNFKATRYLVTTHFLSKSVQIQRKPLLISLLIRNDNRNDKFSYFFIFISDVVVFSVLTHIDYNRKVVSLKQLDKVVGTQGSPRGFEIELYHGQNTDMSETRYYLYLLWQRLLNNDYKIHSSSLSKISLKTDFQPILVSECSLGSVFNWLSIRHFKSDFIEITHKSY